MTNTLQESGQNSYGFQNSTPPHTLSEEYDKAEKYFGTPSLSASRERCKDILTGHSTELVDKLRLHSQYRRSLNTLKRYGFLTEEGEAKEGDAKVPTYEEVMATFSDEDLKIASGFKDPILCLIPKNSFGAKIRALDAHKKGEQKDAHVNEIYSETDSGSDRITGWIAVLAEGALIPALPGKDGLESKDDERIKGADRHKIAILMAEWASRDGVFGSDPYAKCPYTILEDDPASSDSEVLAAGLLRTDNRFGFTSLPSNHINEDFISRSFVGGGECAVVESE